MTDPRALIPDVILAAPDGAQYLARTPQLLVCAQRGGAVSVVIDAELLPVASITDGQATCLPVGSVRRGFPVSLEDLPPVLAAELAGWLAAQAEPLGTQILASLYPTPPAPEATP
jgi:hypothetical protein